MPDDLPLSVDSVTPKPAAAPVIDNEKKPRIKKMARTILVLLAVPYVLFLLWCLILLSILPDKTGQFDLLIPIGLISAAIGLGVLLVVAIIFGTRLANPKLQPAQRAVAMLKIVAAIIPGFIFGVLVLFSIGGEPPLSIAVIDPVDTTQLTAPIAVTFSAEESVEILKRRGLTPIKFAWDYNGDGEINSQTVEPVVTALYQRSNVYNVTALIQLNDGTERRVIHRLSIPRDVFAVTPSKPVIDEPVKFSIAHLVDDPEQILEVQWDFTGNGDPDVVSTELETFYTFVRQESFPVSAIVKFANQSQETYAKEITVHPPEPLPFEVAINHEPMNLIGPAPFGTVFSIKTKEDISSIEWDFGDGTTKEGELAPHNFNTKGIFPVVATIRNREGDIARLTKVVNVVDTLKINDLQFRGTPTVKNKKLNGDLPVEVELTPVTSLPLITFTWEAPDATEVLSSDTNFKAVYRREGIYNITLLAQDADSKAVRIPLSLEVNPPASDLVILAEPPGGPAPITITFDASETLVPGEVIQGYQWNFNSEDKESIFETRKGRTDQTFETEGVYTVVVKVITEQNTYEEFRKIVIRPPVVDPCFRLSKSPTKAPYSVSFLTECTTGKDKISSYLWNFGDGSQSDREQPDHLFENPGVYNISLTITTDTGTTANYALQIEVPE